MNVEIVPPEPDEEVSRPRSRWTLIAVLVSMGLAVLLVWASGSFGNQTPDPIALPQLLVPPTPTSTTSTTSAATVSTQPTADAAGPAPALQVMRSPLTDFVPGLAGQLVALQGQGSTLLITREADLPDTTFMVAPGAFAGNAGFDASEGLIGLIASFPEGDRLYLGDDPDLIDTTLTVTSYAWHETQPAQIAVVMIGSPEDLGSLTTFGFDQTMRQLSRPNYVARFDSPRNLRGWNDSGFILEGFEEGSDSSFVEFVDLNGETLWHQSGEAIDVSSLGTILIGHQVDDSWDLQIVDSSDRDGVPGEVIDWAPTRFNAARWSTKGDKIAFIGDVGEGPADWGLHIYAADSTPLHSAEIPWRVWDIQWSSDDRYVVMPGSDNEGSHGVILYDTSTDTVFAVDDFQGWLQWSDLRN